MKKQILLFLFTALAFNSYSQAHFEKGYFIDGKGQKIECLIKNGDWGYNPNSFEYKISEKDEPQKLTTKSVIKSFEIYGVAKYIKSVVDIDRSSEIAGQLSKEQEPIFNKEHLFLKVLIEGKANLYSYHSRNLARFFYSTNDTDVKQLVFKSYVVGIRIRQNIQFKEELLSNLKCNEITLNEVEKLEYYKKDLVSFFEKYNKCSGSDFSNFDINQRKILFNCSIRPRLNYGKIYVKHGISSALDVDFDFESQVSIGIEAEVILPINNNKWSVFLEPNYQQFIGEKTISELTTVATGEFTANVNYQSIDLPLGVRHYFFLNDKSKIFINAASVFSFDWSKSPITLTHDSNNVFDPIDITNGINVAFGAGYKLMDKYSLEVRYQTVRGVLNNSLIWKGQFQSASFILGYTLF